ncbi:alpha/beta hydrolase [Nocardia zapadnayensis]|uniref:alpha/beta hydrolase n=1 Tax=Nocardia rhamnosiphila TaxID=426716 RepID=UPI00224624BC|nr:alpha/beta hydrolase [Nocardia zapadnayensis]MCX0269574.1 alpha/beta hydrolase [Nocardia zapadnayensis]
MRGAGWRHDDFDSLAGELHPGIFQARLLARRLEQIVLDMGQGISETLYRRARDAALRGEHELITADADHNRVLARLLRQQPVGVPLRAAVPDIGLPGNPHQLRDAWENLSESDRAELFHMDPFIGNRDGIPQADRDMYHRRTLDDLLRKAENSGDVSRIETYREIKAALDNAEDEEVRLHLSYLDGNGRFALSRDNPDFADNNVVLLAAAARDFERLGYAIPTSQQLRQLALLASPNARTSVTFWGGYHQPKSMVQAMFPHFAQDGAVAVRDFHEGLRATHEGPRPAHTTTIGHSYASVLAGHAAGHGGTLNTDNIVFMGSWGTGVDRVTDLSLTGVAPERTGERVFAAMSDSDIMHLMPETFGPAPTDGVYNARVMESTSLMPGNLNLYDHDADAYLHSSNPASESIGLIITGQGDRVR